MGLKTGLFPTGAEDTLLVRYESQWVQLFRLVTLLRSFYLYLTVFDLERFDGLNACTLKSLNKVLY